MISLAIRYIIKVFLYSQQQIIDRSKYPRFPIMCIILLIIFDAQFILSSIFNETPFSTTVSVGGVTSGRGGGRFV